MTRGLVWVTRTDPFNRLTAKRLAGAGYEPLSSPALRIVAIPTRPLTAVPDALVFTSLNGIRLHRFTPALADIPVFAVGEPSARFARARGYSRVTSAAGNIADLCRTIRLDPSAPADILHVGAVSPAGDLGAMLGSSYRVRRLPVYMTSRRAIRATWNGSRAVLRLSGISSCIRRAPGYMSRAGSARPCRTGGG